MLLPNEFVKLVKNDGRIYLIPNPFSSFLSSRPFIKKKSSVSA
jgi:hypothetical protein